MNDIPAKKTAYLVITEKFLPRKGGSNMWYYEAYRRLGDRSTHIVAADQPGAAEFDKGQTNTIHRINLQRHPWLKPESLLMYAKLFWHSLDVGRKNPIDQVHAGRALPEGLVAWVVARLLRKPLVVYCHGEELTTWTQFFKYRFMRFTYHRADHIIVNSDWTKRELLKMGVDEAKLQLIFPGVDTARFTTGLSTDGLRSGIGIDEHPKLIVSVGRLTRRKGFDYVIRALPALLEKGLDIHHVIIGIGEDKEYLLDIAKELNLQDRVHFLGHVPEQDLPRWYNAADVFILPNREIDGDVEGFGIVFIEASACGCPVIAGSAGGTENAVLPNETGLRIQGEDIGQIQDALFSLLTDTELSNRLVRNGLQRVRSELTWDRSVEKMSRIGK